MIYTSTPKKIRVMFTPFRDGLQSSFGGKVRLKDILPAMEYSAKEAGIRHFEFGGGARYQAPFFYVNEDPFVCMDEMRKAVGPDVDLQILTRSVSGVTLTTQKIKALALQAKLMHKHGTTWDRNFDYMNDVDNLVRTGKPIVDAGMHHQVCVAMMGLPFDSDKVHTAEFYVNIIRELLKRDILFHSVCMKDASGTTDPRTCYETAKGLKKILPPEVILWQHTHDTASMAVACYMAGIDGGVDGIDLSCHPMASGTVSARGPLDVARPQGDRLLPRHRRHQDGHDSEHAGGGPQGLRLQPRDHHRRRPGRRLPHAGRRDRPQRPHDEGGGHPQQVLRMSWRSSRWSSRRAAPGRA